MVCKVYIYTIRGAVMGGNDMLGGPKVVDLRGPHGAEDGTASINMASVATVAMIPPEPHYLKVQDAFCSVGFGSYWTHCCYCVVPLSLAFDP